MGSSKSLLFRIQSSVAGVFSVQSLEDFDAGKTRAKRTREAEEEGLAAKGWRRGAFVFAYLSLSLLVMGPLLAPGFVLSMDMVFTPQLRMPAHLDNTYAFYSLLHVLNIVVPADLLQKIMLLAILLLSGIGMHRLLLMVGPAAGRYRLWPGRVYPHTIDTLHSGIHRNICRWQMFLCIRRFALRLTLYGVGVYSPWPVYFGGILYMINPFVYDRFMAGQYGVLLGYALLPWFVYSLLSFAQRPSRRQVMKLALWATLLSVVSIHSLGLMVVLSVGALVLYGRDKQRLRRIASYGSLGALVFASLGAYWLLPTILGQGRIAESLPTFTSSERQAFATVDTNGTTQLGAVLGLQGFWQDDRGLYILPIDAIHQWGFIQLALLVVMGIGVAAAFRSQRAMAWYFVGVSVAAIILALGVGNEWMAAHLPFFAGYREPQKFVALLALCYGYFGAWGASWLLQRVRAWSPRLVYGFGSALLLLPLAYTPTMLGGFYGQLRAVSYPAEWLAINERLNADRSDVKVLFLPWHLYMGYNFVGRIIGSPANAFFDKPVITSDDPELLGVTPQTNNLVKADIQYRVLPAAERNDPIESELRKLHIKYIVLAKEFDYKDYDYLDRQPHVRLVVDTPTLRLYELTHGTMDQHEND